MNRCKGIHIYYGNSCMSAGAAAKFCIGAAAQNQHVLIYKFMHYHHKDEVRKPDSWKNIEIIEGPRAAKSGMQMTLEERHVAHQKSNEDFFEIAKLAENFDIIVLEEVFCAIDNGLLDEDLLMYFLDSRHNGLDVVLTGINPTERLLSRATSVTELLPRKHVAAEHG